METEVKTETRDETGGCCAPQGAAGNAVPRDDEAIVDRVRERYGDIALESTGCGCGNAGTGGVAEDEVARRIGYAGEELKALPEEANLGLGCGAPIPALELQNGETVLDLGSGAGVDVFLAARLVGREGLVIGVDMTPEMIERARTAAASGGFSQVEFRQGRLEDLPVEDGTVDAVTSNCVINLVPDKARVFGEVARVLKPGGRLVISDIVLERRLPEAIEGDLLAYVGCVAGAMQRETYFRALADAGLGELEILKDVDFLATAAELLPAAIEARLEEAGLTVEDLRGVVRSVTFRATRT